MRRERIRFSFFIWVWAQASSRTCVFVCVQGDRRVLETWKCMKIENAQLIHRRIELPHEQRRSQPRRKRFDWHQELLVVVEFCGV